MVSDLYRMMSKNGKMDVGSQKDFIIYCFNYFINSFTVYASYLAKENRTIEEKLISGYRADLTELKNMIAQGKELNLTAGIINRIRNVSIKASVQTTLLEVHPDHVWEIKAFCSSFAEVEELAKVATDLI